MRAVTLDPQLVFLCSPAALYAARSNRVEDFAESDDHAVGGRLVLFHGAVAVVAHYWVGLPWAAAFVLGAIISAGRGRGDVGDPAVRCRKILSSLKVEPRERRHGSGDMRFAVAAVVAGTFSVVEAGWQFLLVGFGGIVLGLFGGWLSVRLLQWLDRNDCADSKLLITVTLLTPFAVYLPAEHLHISGVLAAVTAGLWVGNRCEDVFRQDLYEEARTVWEWVEFLLNSLVFILIGFALRTILENLGGKYTLEELLVYAAGVSMAAIVARLVWVYPGAYVPRWLDRVLFGVPTPYPPLRNVFVVGWTGMRGVVSLAAALALPLTTADGEPFPGRDLIQFLTFGVIFATLVGQGLTLPFVIRGLGVSSEIEPETETSNAE